MAATETDWAYPESGAFEDGDNWTNGLPDGSTETIISEPGTYTVTLSSAQSVGLLAVVGTGITFLETASGALESGGDSTDEALDVGYSANMILDAANPDLVGMVDDNVGGVLTLGAAGALGTSTLYLYEEGVLRSGASLTLNNTIDLSDNGTFETVQVSAAHATTFTLNGDLEFASSVVIGSKTDNGVVVLAPTAGGQVLDMNGDSVEDYTMEVAGGTLRIGSTIASDLFVSTDGGDQEAGYALMLDSGATLDLNGYATTIDAISGAGAIKNAGAVATLTLIGGSLSGAISGNINLTIGTATSPYYVSQGVTTSGPISITGAIQLYARLVVTSAGTISAPITGIGNGELLYEGAGTFTVRGSITGGQAFSYLGGPLTLSGLISGDTLVGAVDSGLLTISHANSFTAGVIVENGEVSIASTAALGTGALELDDSTLLSTASGSVANEIELVGDANTIAAAHGRVVDLTGMLTPSPNSTSQLEGQLTLGAVGDDGVIVDDLDMTTSFQTLDVAYGTLRIGAADAGDVLAETLNTILATGTKLDLYGNEIAIIGLSGGGSVVDTGGAAADLVIEGGNFAGVISGDIATEFVGALDGFPGTFVVNKAQTYTGGSTIDVGAILALGAGGIGGSVKGAIIDNGTLTLNQSGTVTVANLISGTGGFQQRGTGTVTLTGANSYSGGTLVKAGTLVVADGSELGTSAVTIKGGELQASGSDPLGSGPIALSGGELLYETTATLAQEIDYGASATLATAQGTTLTLTGDQEVAVAGTITFGEGANNGLIILGPSDGLGAAGYDIDVHAGTVRAGAASTNNLIGDADVLTVDVGATFDTGGFATSLVSLAGAGSITDSAGASALIVDGGSLSGTVSGKISLEAQANLTLGGAGTFTKLMVDAGVSVTLGAASSELIALAGAGSDLVLTSTAHTGRIQGFVNGDTLDLREIAYSASDKISYNSSNGILAVTGGGQSQFFTLTGSYSVGEFSLKDDGQGGTYLMVAAPGGQARPTAEPLVPQATGASRSADVLRQAVAAFRTETGAHSLLGADRHDAILAQALAAPGSLGRHALTA